MKIKILALCLLLATGLCSAQVLQVCRTVYLGVRGVDPTTGQEDPTRGPVLIPTISLDDYTLTFETSCDGCLLRLVDDSDEVVYSLVIPTGTTSLVLPSYLSGTYELQIIQGNYCFYGDITL